MTTCAPPTRGTCGNDQATTDSARVPLSSKFEKSPNSGAGNLTRRLERRLTQAPMAALSWPEAAGPGSVGRPPAPWQGRTLLW